MATIEIPAIIKGHAADAASGDAIIKEGGKLTAAKPPILIPNSNLRTLHRRINRLRIQSSLRH